MDPWVIISNLGPIEIIILIIIVIFISLLINTICLKIGLAIFDSKNEEFGSVFVTALVCALIGWIPCIGCILCWVIINSRHDTGFLQAIVVWLIAAIISGLIAWVIYIFLF
ncbi:MAG: hypothetical protein ACTSRI_05375 [Promethearchaeota archaeon]